MASGGRRKGAGRPATGIAGPRKTITIRVDADTIDMLTELRELGYNLGREVDKMVTFRWLSKVGGKGR